MNILYSPGKSPQNYSSVFKLNFDFMKNSTVPVMVLHPPGPPFGPPPPPGGFKSKKEIEQDNRLKKLPMMKVNNLDYSPRNLKIFHHPWK
jgi:hypothetical protein